MIQLHNVDLKLLRVFDSVVKSGGFSAAQARLNVAQSTISEQMGQLEARLGVRLCERGRGGFRLTEQGAAIHAATGSLLAAVDKFRLEADMQKKRVSGPLNFGVIDNTITDPEAPVIGATRRFLARGYDVHITVYVGSPAALETRVLDGRLHFAIGHFPSKVAGLVYAPLYRETHGLYCGPGHPLHAGNFRGAELMQRIFSSDIVSRSYMQQSEIKVLGVDKVAATVDNVEAQALLILSGSYLGFLPCHYAARWVDAGNLKQLLPARAMLQSPFELITRRGVAPPLGVQRFLDELTKHKPLGG